MSLIHHVPACLIVPRHILFARLVRLHQSGVVHNDIEPRNVTHSEKTGPLIIDFDEASCDHVCTGESCKELCRVAQLLQLDAGKSDPDSISALT